MRATAIPTQNNLPEFVVRACDLAYQRHGDQTRRDGHTLYIEHVQRVALAMRARGNDKAEAVAWLHDVIEDTGPIDWGSARFPASVEAAVLALTKNPLTSYEEYISEVAQNGLARIVKIVDICDNLSDAPTTNQVAKYLDALKRLTAISVGRGDENHLADQVT